MHGNSEFTSLDQFEREHYLFTQISKLTFFQQFWKCKLFRMWHRIFALQMRAAQDRLRENSFPSRGEAAASDYELSLECQQAGLYRIDTARVYTLDEFCEVQSQGFVDSRWTGKN